MSYYVNIILYYNILYYIIIYGAQHFLIVLTCAKRSLIALNFENLSPYAKTNLDVFHFLNCDDFYVNIIYVTVNNKVLYQVKFWILSLSYL